MYIRRMCSTIPYQPHFAHVAVPELLQCVGGARLDGQHQFTLVLCLEVTSDLQQCWGQFRVENEEIFLQKLPTSVNFPVEHSNIHVIINQCRFHNSYVHYMYVVGPVSSRFPLMHVAYYMCMCNITIDGADEIILACIHMYVHSIHVHTRTYKD